MKVLIVNSMQPFFWGRVDELAFSLQKNLVMAGHEAEILRIPFQAEPAACIPTQMLMIRAFELWNVDHVIALNFPAYLIRHPKKTLWLMEPFHQVRDVFDVDMSSLPQGQLKENIRVLVRNADKESFAECRGVFASSDIMRERLLKFNGFDAEMLFPPINDPELFSGGGVGDYIFFGGRMNGVAGPHLLLEALSLTKSTVKLVIGGPLDNFSDAEQLRKYIARLGISDRVKLDFRDLSREIYAGYVNSSAAVAYLSFDDDSLGYIATEAATAGKALITTADNKNILGLVKHKITGWVAESTPESLAEVMDEVQGDPVLTRQCGFAARKLWQSLRINWPRTIEKLLK